MEKKIIAGFTATAFLLLLFGYYSVVQMRELSDLTQKMFAHPLAVTNATKTIQIKFLTIQNLLEELEEAKNNEKIDQIAQTISQEEKEILQLYSLVFERYLGKKEDIEKSYNGFLRWYEMHQSMIESIKVNRAGESARIYRNSIEQLDQDIKTLIDFAKNKSEYFLHHAQQTAQQTITATIIIIIFAVLGIFLGVYWLVRSIHISQQQLQKQQNELIRTSRELSEAQKIAKLGLWRWDIPNDQITWDSVAYNLCEKNKEHPVHHIQDVYDMIYPEDLIKVQAAVEEYFLQGKPYLLSCRILTEKGNVKHIKAQCITDYDKEGNPAVLYGILQDITEEIASQEHLLHQSRLAQMGEMISMIAHQWRQPLGAIASTVIDLKMRIELQAYNLEIKHDREEFHTYLNQSLDDVDRFVKNLTTTIDDFRNFYKQNKKIELTTLVEPIQQCLDLMKGAFETSGVTVEFDPTCSKSIMIYPNEVVQVILNILKNALDNFREKKIKEKKITILCTNTETGIKIDICDNGGGIPEKILHKIFDPYFSTKNEKNGTGLGLYMSKIIIEDHHGGSLYASNLPHGACFTISLKEVP